jgi:adenylate kinase
MKLIFLGAPGAGKGTIAKMTAEKYSIPQISTGDLFRENMAGETELGKKAKEFIDKGELVPDEITVGMLKERIAKEDCQKGYILDGFPRTIPQAEAFESIDKVDKVINFEVTEETVMKRLTTRRTCKGCGAIFNVVTIPPKVEGVCDKCGGELVQRSDETEEVIKNRLVVYHEQTAPLVDFYRKKGLIADVDANPTGPEPIFAETVKVLQKLAE